MTPAARPNPSAKDFGVVSRTDFVRYAGASGDFNPVHHDDEYARALGFPSVFAMGMFPAGALGAYVAEWVDPHELKTFSVRFQAPTWPGDVLRFDAREEDEGGFGLTVTCGGEPRIVGRAGFVEAAPDSRTTPEGADARLASIQATVLGPVTLPVERGKVLEFARAVKANGVFTNLELAVAAGFADVPATPTFTTCVAHWDGGDAKAVPIALGLELARVLHAEQKYVFHTPVLAGQTLHGTRRVSSAYTKTNRAGGVMTFVGISTEFVDDTGSPVLSEEMIMVETPPAS